MECHARTSDASLRDIPKMAVKKSKADIWYRGFD